MDTLYMVMPAYNEAENIEKVVRGWMTELESIVAAKEASEDSRLVVADEGSTDGTRRILESLQAEYPRLALLPDTRKEHGPKLMALYYYAIRSGADFVFQTDSDGQTNPAEFGAFWTRRDRYDAIFGCRPVRGDGRDRAVVEKGVCALLKVYFGVTVPDANAPFRLMKTSCLAQYLPLLPAEYELPNVMLTALFARGRGKITFRNISFKAREHGEGSVDVKKILKTGVKALGDFYKFREKI